MGKGKHAAGRKKRKRLHTNGSSSGKASKKGKPSTIEERRANFELSQVLEANAKMVVGPERVVSNGNGGLYLTLKLLDEGERESD
jgi:hypothetical protein